MHIAVHGTAYAGVQLVWIQQKNNRVCDAHPVAFLVDPRGIALDFCEANAPNGERGASQKSSVTVLKRSTGAFSHWVQFPSLREHQKEKEDADGRAKLAEKLSKAEVSKASAFRY